MTPTVVHPEAFQSPQRKIRLLLASLPVFAGLLSQDGTVMECNFAPLGQSLDSKSDWVGRAFEDGPWWNYSEESRSDILVMLGRAREGVRVSRERLYRRTDGSMGVMTLSLNPLYAPYGQPDAILVMAVDVTERRRAAESAKRVAVDMAHRLRNSFTIMGLLATRGEPVDDAASRARLSTRLSRVRTGHNLAFRYLFFSVPIEDVVRAAVPDPLIVRDEFVPASVPSKHVESLLLALGELALAGRPASIEAVRRQVDDAPHLLLSWSEDAPRDDLAAMGKLSRLLIEDALAMQTDGTVEIVNDERGFRWSLDMPLAEAPQESSAA